MVKGSDAAVCNVQFVERRHPFYRARVSTGIHDRTNPSNPTAYIEVTVNVKEHKSECLCLHWDEFGYNCGHVKAVLLQLREHGSDKEWVHERYHVQTYVDSYSAKIPAMTLSGQLRHDPNFVPPDYKRPAGRPTKKRKDRSIYRTTSTQRECKACGRYGHMASTCEQPSTEFRYLTNLNKAIQYCEKRECVMLEDV